MSMADRFCFQCNKKLGRIINFGLSELGKKAAPKGMTNNDKLCGDCYNKLPKKTEEEKAKEKEIEEEQDKEHKKKIDEIKSHFQKGSMIYKDEFCAILKKNRRFDIRHAF
jgi:hypothetical protein